MTATAHRGTQAPASRRAARRGTCMGAAVLLIIQLGPGIGVHLPVTPPGHESFVPAVSGPAAPAAHGFVALVLPAAAISALVRAIRSRTAIVVTSAGPAAVLAAAIAGASLASHQGHGASPAVALATAVAMSCCLAAIFTLR